MLTALHAKLREGRKKIGLTQKDAAMKVGKDRVWLNKVEHGKERPSIETAQKLFHVYGESFTPDQIIQLFFESETAGMTEDEENLISAYRADDFNAMLSIITHCMMKGEENGCQK